MTEQLNPVLTAPEVNGLGAGVGPLGELGITGAMEPEETGAMEPEETGAMEPEETGAMEPEETGAVDSAKLRLTMERRRITVVKSLMIDDGPRIKKEERISHEVKTMNQQIVFSKIVVFCPCPRRNSPNHNSAPGFFV
jgi:hypothetical protein